ELGVVGAGIGDNGVVSVTNTGAVTAGRAGVGGLVDGNGSTLAVNNSGSVVAQDFGVIAAAFGNNTSTQVQSSGSVTAGQIGVGGLVAGDNTVLGVRSTGPVSAGSVGVAGVSSGSGSVDIAVQNSVRSDGIGVLAVKDGAGNTTIGLDGPVSGRSAAATAGDGVRVENSNGNGLVQVTTTASGTIAASGSGLSVTKTNSSGDGTNAVIASLSGAINAGQNGVYINQTNGDGAVLVTTSAAITAGATGIAVAKSTGSGDISVQSNAGITALNGITASGVAQNGNILIATAANTAVSAGASGITATKTAGGSGAVSVTTGSGSTIAAGGAGITATNNGTGNTVAVATGTASTVRAGQTAITAGGADSVTVVTGIGSFVRGDSLQTGAGGAVAVTGASVATINIGANSVASGAGFGTSGAVISATSSSGTSINIAGGALVTPWAFDGSSPANTDLVTAAGRTAITAQGGAAVVNNYGTVVGRVGLSGSNDTFNNYSSNTWIVVGDNSFGGGYDTLTNPGRIVTALQGGVAEQTSFGSLETFVNGAPAGGGSGLLTMIDEVPGQLAFNAARDVTYTSGTFTGTGNSTLGVDAYLGGLGSTADKLVIGGLDANGNPISGTVASGSTKVLVNDVSLTAGSYNPMGILVAEAQNGSIGPFSFTIDPASTNYSTKLGGVIDKGLFFYDMVTAPTPSGGVGEYLVGVPGQQAFEFPSFITGAQTIWHETTGLWLDRQVDLRSYEMNPSLAAPATGTNQAGKGDLAGGAATTRPTLGPGLWAKAVGSWMSRDSSSGYSILGNSYGFNTSYTQNTYGFIVGADFSREMEKGTWLFGMLGGYLNSSLDFNKSSTSGDYNGGTVGLYATYINGGLFVDTLMKVDILNLDYSAPSLGGFGQTSQTQNATSFGFHIDTGYRMPLKNGMFVEPVATVSYVNTDIGDFTGIGGATVQMNNSDSLRGALGARFGGRILNGDSYWMEASAVGRLWYEFDGYNKATLLTTGMPFSATDDFHGAFGEVGGNLNIFSKVNGWSGFVNGNVKFNGDFTSGTALTGVRYKW
ncbi:autotransporter domain-containing protein, partial [Pseudoxanthobacter sp.]|uniref:autotransporter domain-containing protein n=1 Tax=Pseudoxanthobacter sp. TaxID=1925742 RepID=UPI002FE003CA